MHRIIPPQDYAAAGFLQLIIIFYKRNKPKEFTWLIMHVQRACLNES